MKHSLIAACALALISTAASAALPTDPYGEFRSLGHRISSAQAVFTIGEQLLEDDSAIISGSGTVDANGLAKFSVVALASTASGPMEFKIQGTAQAGVDNEGAVLMGGKSYRATIRVARKDGCVSNQCPAAIRASVTIDGGRAVDISVPAIEAPRS